MAIAPLIVAVRTTGAAALARTAAQFRAMAGSVRAAGTRMAAAARTSSTFTAGLGRLSAALRRVAVAALAAARAIRGPLTRAMRTAARAAGNLMQSLAKLAARWALLGGLGFAFLIPAVGIVGNLLGGIQLLAPAIVAIVAAVATWKMAMRGFGDALNADDAEELEAALKKLSPSARSAALTLRDLGREWKSTQQKVQESFFKGAREDFIAVSRAIQGVADVWLPKLAKAFADARTWISQVLTAAADSGQLDRIMAGVHQFLRGMLAAIPYLTQAFLDVAEAAAPAFGALGDSISGAAQRFAEWIRELKENGTLQEWIDKAKETFGQLKAIGKEVGRVFAAIFKGSDSQTFLENLKDSISKLADWLESDDGQAVIKFFGDVAAAAAKLIVTISEVVGFFKRGWDNFREATEGLRNAVVLAFGAIGGAGTALFAIIKGGASAFDWISGVGGKLGGLIAAVQGAVRSINTALSAITRTIFIDIITRRSESKGWAKPITGGGGGGGVTPKFFASGGILQRGRLAVVGERGPEFVTLGATSRIYNNAESTRMARSAGGSAAPSWEGSMSGLDALFFRWLQGAVRTGKLKLN